ncbi:MAG: hypothetical protein WCO82_09225 [Sphingomonadales bacterium]|jgi:cation transport regulator ChaB
MFTEVATFVDAQPVTELGAGLLLAMLAAAWLGQRGVRAKASEHVPAAAAMVSLLSLVIGFTFNVALNRYDERRDLVVEEAAAITMAWERARLLPAPVQAQTEPLLRRYVDERRAYFQTGLATDRQRAPDLPARQVRQALWNVAAAAESAGDKPLMVRAFLDALTRLDDAAARREAMAREHIPLNVVLLIALFGVITAFGLGHVAAGRRAWPVQGGFFLIVSLAMITVLDLDRPRTGFARVSQRPMQELEVLIDGQARP